MSIDFTQDERSLSVTTHLGKDVLLLTGFRGEEKISKLFRFELDVLSEKLDLNPKDLVGHPVGWSVRGEEDEVRHFHGMATQLIAGPMEGRTLRVYRLEVSPALRTLDLQSDCRIFEEKDAVQIVEVLLKDNAIDYRSNIRRTLQKREYCVQYRETDFAFISRLLEEEGVFYYFQHEESKHTLCLSDHVGGYAALDSPVEQSEGTEIGGYITSWERHWDLRPNLWVQSDYNFQTPSSNLQASTKSIIKSQLYKGAGHFDHPGRFPDTAVGKALTTVRMEQEEADHCTINGRSGRIDFSPGIKFKLSSHTLESEAGQEYVIIEVDHRAAEDTYLVGEGRQEPYENAFICVPAKTPVRPRLLTPKAVAHGPQTAVVVGERGSTTDIFTDKFGRVKVKFHWDRENKSVAKHASCWMRVAQMWSGAGWGGLFLPRIGSEVVVDFLNGDPDRPIVTGYMHNPELPPPIKLPDDQTQSAIRSHTIQGKADNYNEIRFEDKAKAEGFFLQAERDMTRVVKNDDVIKIGFETKDKGDQSLSVFNNQTINVGTDKSKDGSQSVTIHKNADLKVKTGDRSITIDKGSRIVKIKTGDDKLNVDKGNRAATISKGNDDLTVSKGNLTIKVPAAKASVTAGKEILLKVGGSSIKMDPQSITIKAGASSIKLDPAGITLSAVKIDINAKAQLSAQSATTKVGAQAMLDVQGGPMTKITSAGIMMIQGALVKIN